MAVVSAVYKVSNEELNTQIQSDFFELTKIEMEGNLSYCALDFLEILGSYSEIDRKLINKLLEGDKSYNPADGFIGYSTAEEVRKNKIEIFDKITVENFDAYLERGLKDKHAHTSENNNPAIQAYFRHIKNTYESAANENKALIFRVG